MHYKNMCCISLQTKVKNFKFAVYGKIKLKANQGIFYIKLVVKPIIYAYNIHT